MHGRTGNVHLVQALQVGRDSARPEVIVLPQIQDLAHYRARGCPRQQCGARGRSANPASPSSSKRFFQRWNAIREIPKYRRVRATWRGSFSACLRILSRQATILACSAFVMPLSSSNGLEYRAGCVTHLLGFHRQGFYDSSFADACRCIQMWTEIARLPGTAPPGWVK
jgi:hypothetical protein